jgi:PTH1 family peptidyl-tRNA hydrolase
MIVIHDELDLEFGDVRAKFDGGHAGHNGLRDISEKCGTNYQRIRFGIGRPPSQVEVADFVLKNFNSEERSRLRELVDIAIDKVENLLQ